MTPFRKVVTRTKATAAAVISGVGALAFNAAAHAQATVPTVVQDQIDESVDLMNVTGLALLGVLVAALGFNWLRKVMK